MKLFVRIGGLIHLPDDGISRALLEQLCAIYPEGRTGNQRHAFTAYLSSDDPKVQQILSLLQEEGMTPWVDKTRRCDKTSEFSLQYFREYDKYDRSVSEYLELFSGYDPDIAVPGEERLGDRTVTKINEPGKADICMISPGSYTHVAVQRARDALEAANLKGLEFLPVEKNYESVDYGLYDEEDTWWELESDLELPPLAPSMTLVHRDGTPFTGDFSKGCRRVEGFYFPVELHYRRSDLERFGPFDAARTYEQFGPRGPAPRCRALVVSKKFYQVCKQHNIRTRFVPVRIDEE